MLLRLSSSDLNTERPSRNTLTFSKLHISPSSLDMVADFGVDGPGSFTIPDNVPQSVFFSISGGISSGLGVSDKSSESGEVLSA